MKRSDHVSLCATSVSTANSAANNGKKLRKRRELDKMASVNNSSKNRQSRSNSHSKKLLNIDGNGHLSFSSSDDELDDDDEDDIRHHDGEAYIHLKPSKRGVVGAKYHWLKRNQKLIGFCHKSCYFFVVLSGFLVLLTLAWLHFSLRAQTQDLNAQLRQVLEDKSNQELNQDQFKSQLELLSQNQTLLHDNLTQIVAQLQQLNSQVLTLNQSISQALTTLRGAPQLKDVPEKISKMNQELGQFGSRLTGIESQVQTLQGDLAKVQTKLKTVDVSTNIDASSSEHLEKAALDELKVEFDTKLLNESARMETRMNNYENNFKTLATNLTEQLQKQEIHASKSWKLLDQLNNDLQNISAKAASNELVSRNNQIAITELQQQHQKAEAQKLLDKSEDDHETKT